MGDQPHDKLFKETFSNLDDAAGELRSVLPPELLERLDLSTLALKPGSFLDRKLRASHSDLLFSVQLAGEPAFLYLLFEHLSAPDRFVVLRLLRYSCRIWDRFLKEHRDAQTLPPVIPIVLYQGQRAWSGPRNFHKLLRPSPAELPELQRLTPAFEFLLDDLHTQSDEQLRSRALSQAAQATLWAMRDARNGQQFLHALATWGPILAELCATRSGLAAVELILGYTAQAGSDLQAEELAERLASLAGPEAAQVMSSIAEQLHQKGREEGREEGRQEGQRLTLLRLLRLRFQPLPENVVARIEAANSEQLELWAERVLTAQTLDEVLRD
jgi:predicted transposase/invertase (TIGR01784 family)